MNTLLFVYNANSGTINTLLDVGHKLFSPNTYQCNLCALTFNMFSENKQWKEFREESNIHMKFYHVDEFKKDFPKASYEYPLVLKQDDNRLNSFISKNELNSLTSLNELITRINSGFIFL